MRPTQPDVGPPRSHLLAPLSGLRFLAALHIFLFHVYALHRLAPAQAGYDVFEALPAAAVHLIAHGFGATSLFFLLSGFILTYLYVGPDGRPTTRPRAFLAARVARVYPLHLAALVLVAPAALTTGADWVPEPTLLGRPVSYPAYVAVGGVLCATLTQAWFPEYALAWNPPTWALSAVVCFYLVFPAAARALARLSRAAQWALLALLPALALVPSAVYLLAGGAGSPLATEPGPPRLGLEFVMRWPPLWLPHFVMGMLLARVRNVTRHDPAWRRPGRSRITPGDGAALACVAVFLLDDAAIARALGVPGNAPPLLLRHGLLAPLYLVMLSDLADGRGLLARGLALRPLAALGDASFAIFILQVPVLILDLVLLRGLGVPSGLRLAGVTGLTVAAGLASARLFEKPLAGSVAVDMSFIRPPLSHR